MKSYNKIALSFLFAIFVIATSCTSNKSTDNGKRESREFKNRYEACLESPYLYVDKNGVYHIDENCFILSVGRYDFDSDTSAIYSARYIRKDQIADWEEFASEHQLCLECFNSYILMSLVEESFRRDSILDK